MSLYDTLREFADSWWLLAMTLFFLGAVGFAFRPGSGALHRDIARIPFRRDRAAGPEDRSSTDG